eukprot:m.149168 g.149168  ORF g.149168 m.149168 type:complete len:303 (+) comp30642_c0_seq2:3-911(+)
MATESRRHRSTSIRRLSVVQQHLSSQMIDVSLSHPSKPNKHKYSDQEWSQRCELAVAYRIAHHQEWDQVIFNHITFKVEGTDDIPNGPHFLINPFGLRFNEVTASCLLKVSVDGTVIDHGDGSGPLLKQGFVVHSAIHLARPDINCIVHNHHQPTVAIAMTKFGLLPLSQEAIEIIKQVSYHPFEGTATDLSERERMAKSLGPKNRVMILENHGPLTGGSTLPQAFFFMHLLTRACVYQQQALAAVGGDLSKLHILPASQVNIMAARSDSNVLQPGYNSPELTFAAWTREMEDLYGKEHIYK